MLLNDEVLLEANADPDLQQKVNTQSPYIMAAKSCYCTKHNTSTVANLLHDEVAREKEQDLSSLLVFLYFHLLTQITCCIITF